MTPPLQLAALLLAATAATLPAQNPSPQTTAPQTPSRKPAPRPSTLNHNLIFLDPAHGGPDPGAQLPNHILEKDVTLALANRIRTLLAGNDLTVVLAREADTPTPPPADPDQPSAPAAAPTTPTPDQRAGAANHVHPVACILVHATSSGNGVHIVTSPFPPPEILPDTSLTPTSSTAPRLLPWESAQTDSIPQSLRLANEIGTAIARARLPIHISRASVKPIDSLTCPAVAIEIAPLVSGPTPVSDPAYQQRVAEAVATALLFWRGHADPPAPPVQPGLNPADTTVPAPTAPRTHPAPRPKTQPAGPGALPPAKPPAKPAPQPAPQPVPQSTREPTPPPTSQPQALRQTPPELGPGAPPLNQPQTRPGARP